MIGENQVLSTVKGIRIITGDLSYRPSILCCLIIRASRLEVDAVTLLLQYIPRLSLRGTTGHGLLNRSHSFVSLPLPPPYSFPPSSKPAYLVRKAAYSRGTPSSSRETFSCTRYSSDTCYSATI